MPMLYTGSQAGLLSHILDLIQGHHTQARFISYLNSQTFYLFHWHRDFSQYLKRCDLIYLDGKGPLFARKILGACEEQRHTSADFLPTLFSRLDESECRLFIYGHKKNQLEVIQSFLQQNYPMVNVVGAVSGFDQNEERVLRALNETRPHLVILALGSPRQESFLMRHRQNLPASCYFPLGAGLLYLTGQTKRAPQWMSKSGFEWLFRLAQEPRRLFKRYLISNSFLIGWTFSQLIRHGRSQKGIRCQQNNSQVQ